MYLFYPKEQDEAIRELLIKEAGLTSDRTSQFIAFRRYCG